MICVSRKARNSTFRNYVAAETATPVISCCACLSADDMKNFYFAGELQDYYHLLSFNLMRCNTAPTSICLFKQAWPAPSPCGPLTTASAPRLTR